MKNRRKCIREKNTTKTNILMRKFADLVLLDKNPLEDIKNATSISAVILDGEWMDKPSLDQAVKTYPVIKDAQSAAKTKE